MSRLEREIHQQPRVLERLLERQRGLAEELATELRRARPPGLLMVARGSSDNAALYGKYLFGVRNRLVVALAAPSLFTIYRRPPRLKGWAVLGISQSGFSDDICRVMHDARAAGCFTLAITNSPRSPLARLASRVFPLQAGPEQAVAATKSYTAQLMALAMLSAALARRREGWCDLRRVPGWVSATLEMSGDLLAAAQRYRYLERLSVIGRGFNYCTAFELALKLKELTGLTAEPFSSADFRHGPIAMVDRGYAVLAVAPSGRALPDVLRLLTELHRRGAELMVISDRQAALRSAHTKLALPRGVPEWLSPLVAVVPGQALAMELARSRGLPLDSPRGLSKITRTR